MNIFFLDTDPQKAAQFHCDKHVIKMILETSQLLCTAHHLHPNDELPDFLYKKTHVNHPASIWVRKCIANYCWVNCLGLYLCEEYTYRFGKRHKSQDIIEWCTDNFPDIPLFVLKELFGDWVITTPALCMPNIYKQDNAVESYRAYYIGEKQYNKNGKFMFKYTKREAPEWIIQKVKMNGGN